MNIIRLITGITAFILGLVFLIFGTKIAHAFGKFEKASSRVIGYNYRSKSKKHEIQYERVRSIILSVVFFIIGLIVLFYE